MNLSFSFPEIRKADQRSFSLKQLIVNQSYDQVRGTISLLQCIITSLFGKQPCQIHFVFFYKLQKTNKQTKTLWKTASKVFDNELIRGKMTTIIETERLILRIWIEEDENDYFSHPKFAPEHKFSHHVLYRLSVDKCDKWRLFNPIFFIFMNKKVRNGLLNRLALLNF